MTPRQKGTRLIGKIPTDATIRTFKKIATVIYCIVTTATGTPTMDVQFLFLKDGDSYPESLQYRVTMDTGKTIVGPV